LIDGAIERVIEKGENLTPDLGGRASTAKMGDAVAQTL
jgi:isocitrate/isopropylmalate dehydrogenase